VLDYRIDFNTEVMLAILLLAVSFIMAEPTTAIVAAANCTLLLAVIFILEEPTASVAAAANCTHVMH
jgi:hypothetical protein